MYLSQLSKGLVLGCLWLQNSLSSCHPFCMFFPLSIQSYNLFHSICNFSPEQVHLPSVCGFYRSISEMFFNPEKVDPTFWYGKTDHYIFTRYLSQFTARKARYKYLRLYFNLLKRIHSSFVIMKASNIF